MERIQQEEINIFEIKSQMTYLKVRFVEHPQKQTTSAHPYMMQSMEVFLLLVSDAE